MLTVDEALRQVLAHAHLLTAETGELANALGLVLAEEVYSDVDSPPHDKAQVDGYAVRAVDLASGSAELIVLEEVTAGMVPTQSVTAGQATRVMTGAPIPAGADAMVMIERTQLRSVAGRPQGVVQIQVDHIKPGDNIMRRASSLRRDEQVLAPGVELRGIELGVLAEVGRAQVKTYPRPTVAILATGNELVPPGDTPGPGQIRNSNETLLRGLVRRAGGIDLGLGIARDTREDLRRLIEPALRSDVLVLSGGVSAGVLDLAPSVLTELGVEQVFHKLRLKPGKPLWFGVKRGAHRETLVFGLPGNPVSSLVCFELFVRPALAVLRGLGPVGLKQTTAQLTKGFSHRGDRPTYHPARLVESAKGVAIEPLAWQGSGDLRTLVGANSLAIFPAGERRYETGETIDALLLE